MDKYLEKALWNLVESISVCTNCDDREVGCVIYNKKEAKILASGHNTHLDNNCDCDSTKTAQHAEISAIKNLESTYNKKDLIAFVNHAPCSNCTSALSTVVNEVRYKNQKG